MTATPEASAAPPIEEQVLARVELQAFRPTPGVIKFYDTIAPLLCMSDPCYEILSEFPTHDLKVRKIVEAIQRSPENEARFLEYVKKASKKEDSLPTDMAINLFGLANSRNWMLATHIVDIVKTGGADWTKLQVQPQQTL